MRRAHRAVPTGIRSGSNDGTHFFVAPSDAHVFLDVERVTERNELYWVVEKFGKAGEDADPPQPALPRSASTIPSASTSVKNAFANGDASVRCRTTVQSICSRSARAHSSTAL